MTELSDHYMRVRDYARRFSLDESTVYKAKAPGFQGLCHAAGWSRTITPR